VVVAPVFCGARAALPCFIVSHLLAYISRCKGYEYVHDQTDKRGVTFNVGRERLEVVGESKHGERVVWNMRRSGRVDVL
jgi:hypothetical protein